MGTCQPCAAAVPKTIEALAQANREDKTILVWAAGNSNESLCRPGGDSCVGDTETDHLGRPAGLLNASSPSVFAGLMAYIEELRGHSIATVATGEDGEIAVFSNRCGIAADWCIAAPGHGVWFAYFGPHEGEVFRGYARGSGTSFAAPMVTGGLALMKQFFRSQLSSGELVTRLFRTADRSGPYTDRSIYGQGLMDLDAALSPVGEPMVTTGVTTNGAGAAVQQSRLQLGGAFGNGPARAFSGREIAAFDALGAPFWYGLGGLVVPAAAPAPVAQLRDFMAAPAIERRKDSAGSNGSTARDGLRLGVRETPGEAGFGHALLAEGAITLAIGQPERVAMTAFTTEGLDDPKPATGALFAWHPPDAPLALRAGWVSERDSMLSGIAKGAFGDLTADSIFVGFDLDLEAGDWRLSGGPEIGMVRPSVGDGIIARMESLATSAFALHASRPTVGNGTLQVSLAQPLRVEDGDAVLSIPVGRTPDHTIVRQQLAADL